MAAVLRRRPGFSPLTPRWGRCCRLLAAAAPPSHPSRRAAGGGGRVQHRRLGPPPHRPLHSVDAVELREGTQLELETLFDAAAVQAFADVRCPCCPPPPALPPAPSPEPAGAAGERRPQPDPPGRGLRRNDTLRPPHRPRSAPTPPPTPHPHKLRVSARHAGGEYVLYRLRLKHPGLNLPRSEPLSPPASPPAPLNPTARRQSKSCGSRPPCSLVSGCRLRSPSRICARCAPAPG